MTQPLQYGHQRPRAESLYCGGICTVDLQIIQTQIFRIPVDCPLYNCKSAHIINVSVRRCQTVDRKLIYLDVISMTWAINMTIVSIGCLIFNMCCVDCYSTSLLLWSIVNISVRLVVCSSFFRQNQKIKTFSERSQSRYLNKDLWASVQIDSKEYIFKKGQCFSVLNICFDSNVCYCQLLLE